MLFAFAVLTQLIWCIFISSGVLARHLISAAMLMNMFLVFSLSDPKKFMRWVAGTAIGVIIICKLSMLPTALNPIQSFADRLHSQLETTAYLESGAIPPDATLLGCDWWANRDLEYLMHGQGHFDDCLHVLQMKGDTGEKLILVKSDFWESRYDWVLKICQNKVLFKTSLHTVLDCGTKADMLKRLQQMSARPADRKQ
jgi:hypothetical protein